MHTSYMKIPGVPGDSDDNEYAGWIELLYHATTVTTGRTDTRPLPRGQKRPDPPVKFTVRITVGKSAPQLQLHLINKKPIEQVDILFLRPSREGTGKLDRYWQAALTNVTITSMSFWSPDSINPAESRVPELIEVTFVGTKFNWGPVPTVEVSDSWRDK